MTEREEERTIDDDVRQKLTAVADVRRLGTRVRVAEPQEREETRFPPVLLETERCTFRFDLESESGAR